VVSVGSRIAERPQKAFQSPASVQDVVRHRLIEDYRVVARCPAVKQLNARLQLIFSNGNQAEVDIFHFFRE
jgi:hypothetical protein